MMAVSCDDEKKREIRKWIIIIIIMIITITIIQIIIIIIINKV